MIFVNGIQRSGTNFAHKIYKGSFEYVRPYWKHNPKMQGIDPECEKVVCIIKNPYTWVESICFRNKVDIIEWFPSYHLGSRIAPDEFILGPFNIRLVRLMDVYKNFYTSWLNYEKTELVRYEDLLIDHKLDKVPMSADWDPSKRRFYLSQKAPLVPQKAKDIITERLGVDFLERIGYSAK